MSPQDYDEQKNCESCFTKKYDGMSLQKNVMSRILWGLFS